jgi:hypothetical protein
MTLTLILILALVLVYGIAAHVTIVSLEKAPVAVEGQHGFRVMEPAQVEAEGLVLAIHD